MRTTLAIDDDVLAAVKEMATTEGKTIGEVMTTLARKSLAPAESVKKSRNGIPLLRVNRATARVTSELVHELREELM